MRALVCTAPGIMDYRSWPDPQLCPGDALVRVRTAGVCGSDLRAWRSPGRKRVPPFVLGHELAGEVVEIRDPDSKLHPGASVAIFPLIGCHQCQTCRSGQDYLCGKRRELGLQAVGAFAEYLQIPARNLYGLPNEIGFVQGALIEPLSVALHMASWLAEHPGPAAILGAGPIGLLALQAIRRLGVPQVAVAEVNTRRSQLAHDLGAELVVNPAEPDCLELLKRFFGEEGCAVVFDAAGFSATRQLALKLVRTGGHIVLAGGGEAETSFDCADVIGRQIRIQGSFAYSRKDFERAAEWIAKGYVDLSGWVSEAKMADGQRIFEELTQPDSTRVKVVLNT